MARRAFFRIVASLLSVMLVSSIVSVIGFEQVAGASSVTAVTFTPTTTAAGLYTDYDIGFTPTGTISTTLGSTVTVTFPAALTLPASTTVATVSGFTGTCAPTAVIGSSTITVTLAGSGCQLTGGVAGVFALYGFTNPSAQTLTNTNFTLKTSVDSTAVSPASSVVVIAQYPVIPQASWPGTVSNPGLRATVSDPGDPIGVASDGKVVWVANLAGTGGNNVKAFNLTTGALISADTITTTGFPTGIAIDANYLWINLFQGGTNSVEKVPISGATDTPGTPSYVQLPTGQQYYGICDDGTNVWTAQQSASFANYLYKIPVGGTTSSLSINLGTNVSANQITCDGTHVWVAEGGNGTGTIAEFNEATGAAINAAKFPASTFPGAYGIFSDGRYVYIASDSSALLYVLDAATGNQVTGSPFAIPEVSQGVISDGTDVWVAGTGTTTSDMIQIPISAITAGSVNTTTNEAIIPLPNGAGPRFLASTGNEVWLTEQGAGFVTELSNTPQIAPNNGTITNPYEAKYSTLYSLNSGAAGQAYSQTFTASAGNGTYTYAVIAGAAGTISQPATTGQSCLTTLGLSLSSNVLSGTPTVTGTCTFTIQVTDSFGMINYQAYQITITLATQATLVVPTTSTPFNGTAFTVNLSTTGGSGTGTVSYALASSPTSTASGCALSGTNNVTLSATSAGICYVTATKAADGTYSSATSAASAQTFTLATPTVTITSGAPSSPNVGSTYTPTATSTSGATPTFAVTGGCSISGVAPSQVITFTSTTPCNVTASVPASGGYASASSTPQVVTAGLNTQATLVVPTTSTPFNGTAFTVNLSTTGGSGTGTVSYALASSPTSTASGCALSGTNNVTLSATSAGICYVTATKAADGTYSSATSAASAQTFTLATPTVTITSGAPSSPNVGSTYTPTATSTSGATPTFAVTGGCSISGVAPSQVITFTSTTPCNVTASVPASGGYASASSTPQVVTAGLNTQATLVVPTTSTPFNGTAFTVNLSTTGGSGTGTVSYALASSPTSTASGCALSGTNNVTLSATSAGICYVTATKAADGTYSSATSAASAQTFTLATPTVTITSGAPSSPNVGSTYTPTATSTSGATPTFAVTGGCSISGVAPSQVITFTSTTPCNVTASVPASGGYASASSTPQVVTAGLNTQATLVVPTTSTPFNGTAFTVNLSTTGGSGTGTVSYALASSPTSTASGCALSGTNNVTLSATSAGICYVTATKAADGTYSSATSAASAQTFTLATPTVTITSGAPSSPNVGSTYTPTATSTSGATPTFAVTGGCSISGVAPSQVITFTSTTPCNVTASVPASGGYASASSTPQVVTAGLNTQATLVVPTTSTPFNGTAFTVNLSTTGGSGTGTVSYALASSPTSTASGCALSGTNNVTLSATSAGICYVTATKAADGTYSSATSAASAQTFTLATPTVTITSGAPSSPNVGSTYTPTATSTSGATPTFAVTGGCSISGVAPSQVITFTSTTPCNVTASVPASGGYASASSTPQVVTAGLNTQATLVVPTTSTPFNGTAFTVNLSTTGGSGTGTVSYALASSPTSTASGCALSGTNNVTLSATSAGICYVTATKAADGTYSSATSAASAQTFTLATPTVTITSGAPSSPNVGSTYTPTATSTSGATPTFAVTGGCSISGVAPSQVITFTSTTPCNVTASVPASGGYASASSTPQVVTAGLNTQATLVVPTTSTPFNGTAFTVNLSTTGGSGTGTVSYALASSPTSTASGCALSGTNNVTLSATSAGICYVTATKAADGTYSSATSAASAQTFTLATPTVTITSGAPSSPNVGSTYTPTATSTSGATPTFAVTGGCSISGVAPSQVITFTSTTPCNVTASVPASGGYASASSTPQVVTAGLNTQATLVVPTTSTPFNGTAFTVNLSTTGGSGTGTVSYALASSPTSTASGCALSGTNNVTLSATSAGICYVTATKAADGTYSSATSAASAQTFTLATPTVTITSGAPSSPNVGSTYTPTATSTSGATPTFAVTGGCSISGVAPSQVITFTSTTPCNVTASVPASGGYASASSTPQVVTAGLNTQATLVVPTTSTPFNGTAFTVNLSTTGGSGTGTVSYALASSPTSTASGCALSGTNNVTLSATSAGICYVTATKAADGTYSSATSAASAQTFTLATPTVTITSGAPSSPNVGSTYTPTATSTSGATPTFAVTGGCSISGVAPSQVITFTSTTPCNVTASVPASGGYTAASSSPQTVTLGLTSQIITTPSTSTVYNGSAYTVTLSSTSYSGTGTVSYALASSPTSTASGCALSGTNNVTLSATSAGICYVTATIAADANYGTASSAASAQAFTLATPTVTITSGAPSSPNVGSTYTPSATSSAGLPIVFGVSGGCSINAGVVTFTSTTPCVVMASTGVTADYSAAIASPPQVVTAGLNTQATLVVPTTSTPFNGTAFTVNLSTTGGSGTGTVSYALASSPTSTASGCALSGTNNVTLSATSAGICYVTATKAADGTYSSATSAASAQTFTLATPTVTITSGAPSSPNVGSTYTPTATSTSGATPTFAVTGGCSISGVAPSQVITFTSTTPCNVTASVPASGGYASASSTPQVVTAGAATQIITVPNTSTVFNGSAYTVTLSSASYSGTGTVSYALASSPASTASGCALSGTNNVTLSATSAGVCYVTATIAADSTYSDATSAASAQTFTLASPTVTITSGAPSSPNVGSTYTPTATSTSGATPTFDVTGGCSISGVAPSQVITFTSTTPCDITASVPASGGYTAASSSPQTVTLGLTSQIITVPTTSTAYNGATYTVTLSSTSYSGTGTVSYALASSPTSTASGCALSGPNNDTLTATSAGICYVTATIAADSTYSDATSAASAQTFTLASQTVTITSGAPSSPTISSTYTPTATSTSGATPIFAVTGGCSISGVAPSQVITFTSTTPCNVTASVPASVGYLAASSTPQTDTAGLHTQTITVPTTSTAYNGATYTVTLSSTSYSGTGTVSYALASSPTSTASGCALSGPNNDTLTATSAGICYVTATIAADSTYSSATSATSAQTFTAASSGGGGGGGGSVSTPVITTPSLPSTVTGAAYAAPVNETGGVGPFSWGATGLPAGLTIDASGDILGAVTAPASSYPVTVTVTDANGAAYSKTYVLVVGTGLVVATASLPDGVVGQPYSDTLTEQGGTGASTWTCAGLPAGLTCSTGGVISGTPTVAGTFNVTLTVTNGGQTSTVTLPLKVTATASPAGITSLPNLAALPGDGEILVTWSQPSGATPSQGLSYTVSANPGGETCTTTGTSCLIEGLTNGTTYAVSVVVTSTSPASTSSPVMLNNEVPTPNPIVNGPSGIGVVGTTIPKQLSPGLASATQLNGSTGSANVGVGNADIVVSGGGLTMTIAASSTVSTPTGFTIVLVQGGVAHVSGSGFYPGSLVDIYLYPSNVFLGTARVSSNGTYSASLTIPATISTGNHTVLSQGYVKAGKRVSLSVGVVVDSSSEAFLLLFPFAVGSAVLTPTMMSQIRAYAAKIKSIGATSIVFTGYTDIAGGAAYNLNLGRNRALAAENYLRAVLVADGVTVSIQMTVRSLGSTAPAASNNTLAGRARNRNVTVVATLL